MIRELLFFLFLGILRLGTTYEFALGEGWGVGPALYFDIKQGIDTYSASIYLPLSGSAFTW